MNSPVDEKIAQYINQSSLAEKDAEPNILMAQIMKKTNFGRKALCDFLERVCVMKEGNYEVKCLFYFENIAKGMTSPHRHPSGEYLSL